MAVWCQDNNLSFNVSKTKELIVDIPNKLSWYKHTKKLVKRAQQCLFPFRRLKRFGMGPLILKKLYRCTIHRLVWQLLNRLVWQLLGIQP